MKSDPISRPKSGRWRYAGRHDDQVDGAAVEDERGHAGHRRGDPVTAEAIRAAVVAGELEEIARAAAAGADVTDLSGRADAVDNLRHGQAAIRVWALPDSHSGRYYSILIVPSVQNAHGQWVGVPIAQTTYLGSFRRGDRDQTLAENARHKFQYRFAGVEVPIEWVTN